LYVVARLRSTMAKKKIHSGHNQTNKAHKNGIKRPKTNKYISFKGVSGQCGASACVLAVRVQIG